MYEFWKNKRVSCPQAEKKKCARVRERNRERNGRGHTLVVQKTRKKKTYIETHWKYSSQTKNK